MDMRAIDVKAMWHPQGLSELQGILNGNILHSTFDFGQGTPIWKNPIKKVHLLGSFSIRKDLLAQETESVLHYYKSTMPLENKVRIIDPNFGT